eukprot:GHVP01053623.1.p1 GENE.GHVP01053623.1~~GHVP01053623.1.p1  ORF type:complete len:470 (+),score=82.81 GHVP01053623.1:670-2079(+)
MMARIIKIIQFILLILLASLSLAGDLESHEDVNNFKDDVSRTSGKKKVVLDSVQIELSDLCPFYINRPLDELTLKKDALYLMGYIVFENSTNIKKLTLDSDCQNSILREIVNNEIERKGEYLGAVDEVECIGIAAIKEIICGVVFNPCITIKTLKLREETLIHFEDIGIGINNYNELVYLEDEDSSQEDTHSSGSADELNQNIEDTPHKDQEIDPPDDTEEGVDGLEEGVEEETERINHSTKKTQGVRKLILVDGATRLLFTHEFELFGSNIEELSLETSKDIKKSLAEKGVEDVTVNDNKIKLISPTNPLELEETPGSSDYENSDDQKKDTPFILDIELCNIVRIWTSCPKEESQSTASLPSEQHSITNKKRASAKGLGLAAADSDYSPSIGGIPGHLENIDTQKKLLMRIVFVCCASASPSFSELAFSTLKFCTLPIAKNRTHYMPPQYTPPKIIWLPKGESTKAKT